MKLFITAWLLILVTFKSGAQLNNNMNITGNWSVVKVIIADEGLTTSEKKKLSALENMFLKTKYHFGNDNKFSYDTGDPDMKIKNGHWKVESGKCTYIIQDWKDRNTNNSVLMEIDVKRENGKIYFKLSETPLMFEVKKD
ncbi:MAG: DUF5004 domain-containing protein [Bacteroidia bacterium]